MSFFDITVIIIIVGFGLAGLWLGFVQSIGSLLGTVVGVFFAFREYQHIANWLSSFTGWQGNGTKIIIFLLLFLVTSHAIGLIFTLLNKVLDVITSIPFISTINRLLGLALGLAQGIIVVAVTMYFIARFPIDEKFMMALQDSMIAPYLDAVTTIFKPFIPEAIKTIKSTLDGLF